jgi:hypothetical protein
MTTGIDFKNSRQYSLSIRLSADGFSFSIHRPGQAADSPDSFNQSYPIQTSYSLTANLKEMLARTDALQHDYLTTTILVDTARFTTMPQSLFEDEQMEAVFAQNFAPSHNEIVLCNELGESDVVVVFGMDKHAHQWLTERFPDARFFAAVSPLIEHFARLSRQAGGRWLYAHLREQQIEVMAYDHGEPLLLNAFACRLTADRVYYLLYIWKQLGMDAEHDTLHLTGEIREREELLAELRKYVRQVTAEPLSHSRIPYDMQTLLLYD